jgi:Uma2 family endonuclease
MSTASRTRTWTYADLEAMPENQTATRYEIIDGELIVTPAPIPPHEILGIELTYRFVGYVKQHRLGRVFGDHVDYLLSRGEVVNPDLSFIARNRLHIVGPKAIHGAPDLALEILSPSTRRRDLVAKRRLYAREGVREYWIVDPRARTVAVLVLRGADFAELPPEGGLARSEVLPGFTLDPAALFAELD